MLESLVYLPIFSIKKIAGAKTRLDEGKSWSQSQKILSKWKLRQIVKLHEKCYAIFEYWEFWFVTFKFTEK